MLPDRRGVKTISEQTNTVLNFKFKHKKAQKKKKKKKQIKFKIIKKN